MAEASSHTVKRAKCKCALVKEPDAKPEPRAACPNCGVGDTMAAIRKEVGEYVKEQAAISLSKSVSDVSRGSKYLKFTPTFKPRGGHRFIVDLHLE